MSGSRGSGSSSLGPWPSAPALGWGRGGCARPREGAAMQERRVVGLDLGIASAHTAVVLRADGTEVCRPRCSPTVESFIEPEKLARSLPGIAEVGGPVLQAAIARAHRFENASQFRSFTGLTPKASETEETDRKGQPMSKAGSSLLRTQLLRSAEVARTIDPQLARIYFTQMVERGANHLNALCVVGSHLAERSWAVLAWVTARGASRTFMALDEKNQFARVAGHSDGAAGDT